MFFDALVRSKGRSGTRNRPRGKLDLKTLRGKDRLDLKHIPIKSRTESRGKSSYDIFIKTEAYDVSSHLGTQSSKLASPPYTAGVRDMRLWRDCTDQ
jgi:hypothetical protein